jgi:beta-galactosidase/beta-glucuronidase
MNQFLPLMVAFIAIQIAEASAEWAPKQGPLTTRWTKDVTPKDAWTEYPRPQMERPEWRNLNGLWQYSIRSANEAKPTGWDGEILVPFCIESALSGVMKRVSPDQSLWYERAFEVPANWRQQRVLLHFGAVDWQAEIWVNGRFAGGHRGGYDPFTLDITELLADGQNTLTVKVVDPTDSGYQARGKQVLKPKGIWYTPVTGIWQTVWLEQVPSTYIQSLNLAPDLDTSSLLVTANASEAADVRITVFDGDSMVAKADGDTQTPVRIAIEDVEPWSPANPHLYDLKIELLRDGNVVDSVTSYAGMRKIEVKSDANGVNRLWLNGDVLFQYGPLDQGWWPDGLYTAPCDEALKYDIEVTKNLGFNMTRKHVKVEPARWYYWCDKLGLLVWQDMPNGDAHPEWKRGVDERGPELRRSAVSAESFREELTQLVKDFGCHPSIVVWVPFNERWGQSDTAEHVALIRRIDPTRPINSASGGNFYGVGDILDVHSYPDPTIPRRDRHQAIVCGEFGGLGLPVKGHTWLDEGNWGYRSFETEEALQDAYLEKLAMLKPMIAEGLAAAIYTQITDVEVEVNGLLTYDREIVKLNQEVIGKANRSLHEDAD